MRRVGKGFSRVETSFFEGMLVAGVIEEEDDAEEQVQDVAADTAAQGAETTVSGDDVQDQCATYSITIPLATTTISTLSSNTAANFPMSLFQETLDTCAALTRRVEHLEYDKVAQALEITKLKRRVKKLEQANKVKVLKLRRLKNIGTSQRIDSSDDPMMEDASNQGRMVDALDSDAGVALMDDKEEGKNAEEANVAGDDQVKGMQAEIYKIDMDHASNVLIPAATITDAPIRVAAASTRRRKRVVIRDPKEESTTIIPAETKSKDKSKGIMVEEPKPMKKKQQVEMDEEYARKLHEELNKDINWDVSIDHVKQKAKDDPCVQRYQVMKKRPQTKAQARRNMIIYLKNVVRFRLDYLKGMSYDDILRVAAASTRRRKRVVIRDPEEESTTITAADTKSKDNGNRIMVEESKPMKKKQQVEMDEEYARKLHEELNKDIDWDVAIEHVKQKAKEDPFVQRYQVMKKRPQTKAQAQKNMIMYLKNVVGFRLDYFKEMSYDDIRPIFEAKFNSNIVFLIKKRTEQYKASIRLQPKKQPREGN
nr:hypothetical protein [Tanacetum cinerariifolium]